MIIILGRRVMCKIWVATLKVKVTAWPCIKIVSDFWSLILKLFYRNDQHKEVTCHEQHLGRYVEGQGHSMTLQQNRVRSITLLLEVRFTTISQKWSPYWDDMTCATFWSLPWRSRSQHALALKSCPAHNFIIWSPILNLFHRKDCKWQKTGAYDN